MRKNNRLQLMAVRFAFVFLLFALLAPVGVAVGGQYQYFTLHPMAFNSVRYWKCAVDGRPVLPDDEGNQWFLAIRDDQEVDLTLTLDEDYLNGMSRFFRFIFVRSNSHYTKTNALMLADGSYLKIYPLEENLKIMDLRFTAEQDGYTTDHSFLFEGTYLAMPTTQEEMIAHRYWDPSMFDGAPTIQIRFLGQVNDYEWNNNSLFEYCRFPQGTDVQIEYEIDLGNGWEPLPVADITQDLGLSDIPESGINRVYEAHRISVREDDPDAVPMFLEEQAPIETVAVTSVAAAAAAAVLSAVAASSASTAASGAVSVAVDLGESAMFDGMQELPNVEDVERKVTSGAEEAPLENEPEPQAESGDYSILVNGGAPLMQLCATAKASVEIPVTIPGGEHLDWKWMALCIAPDAPNCAGAAVVSVLGGVATVTLLLTREDLPKESVPVFVELSAVTDDENGKHIVVAARMECTLHRKGVRAKLKDPAKAEKTTGYEVTYVKDANLKGIAEIITLPPSGYRVTVERKDGKRCAKISLLPPYSGKVQIFLPE